MSDAIYWHPITPGLVGGLIKLRRHVGKTGINSVHTSKDLNGTENELTKFEYGNWSKLRFHGLVAKDKDAGAGYWLITKKGYAFLRGEPIQQKVMTQHNEVKDHNDVWVTIEDVHGSTPHFVDITNLERDFEQADKQASLFDLVPTTDTAQNVHGGFFGGTA